MSSSEPAFTARLCMRDDIANVPSARTPKVAQMPLKTFFPCASKVCCQVCPSATQAAQPAASAHACPTSSRAVVQLVPAAKAWQASEQQRSDLITGLRKKNIRKEAEPLWITKFAKPASTFGPDCEL